MSYTINAEDTTRPLDSDGAKFGAAELRAIKARIVAVKTALDSADSALQAAVTANTAAIGTNTTNIAANTTAIAANTTAVAAAQSTANNALSAVGALKFKNVLALPQFSNITGGTWTVPAGVTKVYAVLVSGSTAGGAGGFGYAGGGHIMKVGIANGDSVKTTAKLLDVSAGDTITWYVGQGEGIYDIVSVGLLLTNKLITSELAEASYIVHNGITTKTGFPTSQAIPLNAAYNILTGYELMPQARSDGKAYAAQSWSYGAGSYEGVGTLHAGKLGAIYLFY